MPIWKTIIVPVTNAINKDYNLNFTPLEFDGFSVFNITEFGNIK